MAGNKRGVESILADANGYEAQPTSSASIDDDDVAGVGPVGHWRKKRGKRDGKRSDVGGVVGVARSTKGEWCGVREGRGISGSRNRRGGRSRGSDHQRFAGHGLEKVEGTKHRQPRFRPPRQRDDGGEKSEENLNDVGFACDDVVRHVSVFLRLKSPTQSTLNALAGASDASKQGNYDDVSLGYHNSASILSDFLQVNAENRLAHSSCPPSEIAAPNAFIAKKDVAALLLPWSLARLMRAAAATSDASVSHDETCESAVPLAWRALSLCLDTILSSPRRDKAPELVAEEVAAAEAAPWLAPSSSTNPENEALLSTCLLQSTLGRLVPFAARASFSELASSPTKRYASKCFVYLVRRFRPRLDTACGVLLHDVDTFASSLSSSSGMNDYAFLSKPQEIVIAATLTLVRSLLADASAKRSFGIICSMDVLPCLGRLMMVRTETPSCEINDISHGDARRGTSTVSPTVCELLVRNILYEGLFNPVHHIAGFRTMSELQFDAMDDQYDGQIEADNMPKETSEKRRGAKSCFQVNLFVSLEGLFRGLFSPADADASADERSALKSINNAISTANLLPILISGFFKRIHHGSRRGSSGGVTDSGLQFCFWRRATLPAFKQLQLLSNSSLSKERYRLLALVITKAMSMTLGSVLEHDAYSPSYSHPGGCQFKFLDWITKCLSRFTDIDATRGGNSIGSIRQALLSSLSQILSLNHLLLHKRLPEVISFACSCLSCHTSDASPRSERGADALLAAIIRTYGELRQLGHLLLSMRGAFSVVSCPTKRRDYFAVKKLLQYANVHESLYLAYQNLPSGQLQEIWSFIDGWVIDIVQNFGSGPSEDEHKCAADVELSFAVQMFVAFIKNIRTNKHNSLELKSLCERSVNMSVAELLRERSGTAVNLCHPEGLHSVLLHQGFDLCGWLVDLHSRSRFWIDCADVDEVRSSFLLIENNDAENFNVLAYLHHFAKTTVSTDHFKMWRTSWLQSFWKSRSNSDNLGKFCDIGISPPLRGSLQRLALHRIHQLHSLIYYINIEERDNHLQTNHTSSNVLTNEARMLVDFSLYIASSHLNVQSHLMSSLAHESLWSPIAKSLCIWTHYCDNFHSELFLIWFFSSICQEGGGIFSNEERHVAMTLLRDASFYEVGQVMSLFVGVGVRYAFVWLLDCIGGSRQLCEEIAHGSTRFTATCLNMTTAKIYFACTNSTHCALETVSTVLSILASLPLNLTLCNENVILLGRIVGMGILSSQIMKQEIGTSGCCQTLLSSIVRLTNVIIAEILPKTLLLLSDFDYVENVVTYISKDIGIFRYDEGVLAASSHVLGEYLCMSIDYYEKERRILDNFITSMKALVSNITDIDFISIVALVRGVIRKINILDRHQTVPKKNMAQKLCGDFVQYTQNMLQKPFLHHISMEGSGREHSKAAATALLLESEILAFYGNNPVTMQANEHMEAFNEVSQKVLGFIENVCASNCNPDVSNASQYFLASIAATPGQNTQRSLPLPLILENILNALAISHKNGMQSPLLDAAFCSLIRNSNTEETNMITSHTLRKLGTVKRDNLSFSITIFCLLVTCATKQEQHEYISEKCRTFFLLCMSLLRSAPCLRAALVAKVELFSNTMTVFLSKKELLLLGGREISMILCELSPLIHDRVEENEEDGAVIMFKSCCSVVVSLIAHYPKQLYGCPSPLFNLLISLLSNILQTNAKNGVHYKSSEYAKVCEQLIPHKEIFKKHVVGLILRFINALNRGMNPTTKSELMPSVYALLETASDFEIRQVNAMIDVPSKTLFTPIFQSYQKYYQYHGQA